LQGIARARVVREVTQQPYRTAELAPIIEPQCLEIDLSNQRRHLISIFSNGRFSSVPLCQRFLEMLSSLVSTSDIVDLISFNLIDDVHVKQQLLAEPDPRKRATRVAAALERLQILPGFDANQRSVDSGLN
jgi:Lon protease-like protein